MFRHTSRLQTARLYNMTDDPGVRDMLRFNLARDTLLDPEPLGDVAAAPPPDPLLYATYDGSMGKPQDPALGTEAGPIGKLKSKLS